MTVRKALVNAVLGVVVVACGGAPALPSAAPPVTMTVAAPALAPAPAPAPAPSSLASAVGAQQADDTAQRKPDDIVGGVTSSSAEASSTAASGVAVTEAERTRALDGYAARLGQFFRQRWQIPTSVSLADARRLCVTFQANVSRDLVIWHVRAEPTKSSGNTAFDDSGRAMLEKLVQDRTHLPDPPPEIADLFRGRMMRFALTADSKVDPSSCK